MPSLESQIDDLYRAPLDEFTASRNALAKTAGKADAARIKKLPKPTLVPWAVNQVYWRARPTWDRLLKSGERLRHAQLGALKGQRADIRAASEAHRQAVGEAVKAAERIAAQAGAAPPADALARALEALSLMTELPAPAGRLTDAPEPAGFEALSGLQVLGVHKVPEVQNVVCSVRLQPDQNHEAARKKEAAAAKQRAADIAKAEAILDRAKAEAAAARAAHERADRAVAEAQARLAKVKSG